jgi:hypothetical protein
MCQILFESFGLLKEPTLYIVKGMAILDNDGNRILAKYYNKNVFATAKEQKAFEKNLFNKTHRANAEIIMLDGLTCVYRSNVDLFFYVMGSSHENEVFMLSVYNHQLKLYDMLKHIIIIYVYVLHVLLEVIHRGHVCVLGN